MDNKSIKRAQFLINILYITAVAFLAYLALKYVVIWVLPFILAFCIVSAVHPFINRIVKLLSIKREIASIIVIILLYAIVGTLLFLIILQLTFIIRDALSLLPNYYIDTVKPTVLSIGEWFSSFLRDLPEADRAQIASFQGEILSAIQGFLINLSQKGVSLISGLTTGVPSFLIGLIFTIMLSFFISIQYEKVTAFFTTQLPPGVTKIIRDTRIILIDTVFKYIKAAITLMFVTALEISIGLLVLGQKNAIPIAAGIAIFDALPLFGTGGIIIPWALIELIGGNFPLAFGLLMIYATVAFVRSIIEPKIVGDKLGLNRVVSLVSIYLGFRIFGLIGMILMPITTQIILELNRKGSIKLFNTDTDETE